MPDESRLRSVNGLADFHGGTFVLVCAVSESGTLLTTGGRGVKRLSGYASAVKKP